MKRLDYLLQHWKLGIHLLCRTKRFGVNNKWWSNFDSLFYTSFLQHFRIITNWRSMKFRANRCHFLSNESYKLLFGQDK